MISKVGINYKQKTTCFDKSFFVWRNSADRFEKQNAARMSAAREGLTERSNYFLSQFEKENVKKSGRYSLKGRVDIK